MAKNRKNTTDANKLIISGVLWLLIVPVIFRYFTPKLIPMEEYIFYLILFFILIGGAMVMTMGCYKKLSALHTGLKVTFSSIIGILYVLVGGYYFFYLTLLAWKNNL